MCYIVWNIDSIIKYHVLQSCRLYKLDCVRSATLQYIVYYIYYIYIILEYIVFADYCNI